MRRNPSSRRKSRKRLILAAVACLVLIPLLAMGGREMYRRFQPERLTKRGRAFFNAGDYRNAALSATRALQIDKEHIGATHLLADLTDVNGMADALQWRQRVAELQPESVEAHIDCAKIALRLESFATAEQALAAVRAKGADDAEFHAVAGTLAVKLGKLDEAGEHYRAALRLKPENPMYRYNNAAVQLTSQDPAERTAAIATLNQLRSNPGVRTFTRRALIADMIAHGQQREALAIAEELQADPEANFTDKISYLDLLHRRSSQTFPTELAALRQSARKPEEVGILVKWHLENGRVREVLDWASALDKSALAGPRAGAPIAECYLETKDWSGLQAFVKDADWGASEYLRHTYLARALRELGDENGFRAHWNSAISAAAQTRDAAPLAQLANSWGWRDEVRDLLWAVVRDAKEPQWALGLLYRQYTETGNTRGLQRVMSRLMEIDPSNDSATNNFAMFSLLLKTDVSRVADLARRLYEKDKTNPVFASTFAYALYVQGRSEEALEILHALPKEKLEQPPIALYYGVLLADTQPEKAAQLLTLAEKGSLLAEERELIATTRKLLEER